MAAPGLPEREAVDPGRSRVGRRARAGSGIGSAADRDPALPRRRARGRSSAPARPRPARGAAGAHGDARTATARRARCARSRRRSSSLRRWLFWPHAVRGWWATLARELAPADLYHACGSLTIAAALAARERAPDRAVRAAPARVIYDAIDNVAESNEVAGDAPRPSAAGSPGRRPAGHGPPTRIVTVNDALAERLTARWRLDGRRSWSSRTCPSPGPRRRRAASRPDRLRDAAGLPAVDADRPVPGPARARPRARGGGRGRRCWCPTPRSSCSGSGGAWPTSRARDRDPRFAGRHVTLPPAPADELVAWTAVGGRLPHPAAAGLAEPAPLDAEQVLGGGRRRDAGRRRQPGSTSMERIVVEHDLGRRRRQRRARRPRRRDHGGPRPARGPGRTGVASPDRGRRGRTGSAGRRPRPPIARSCGS